MVPISVLSVVVAGTGTCCKGVNFVTRSQWGARAPRSSTYLSASIQKGLAFHWEGPHMGSFSHDKCDDKIRTIQTFHMDSRGWADIAYNFVVCPHGYVFEGRGWGKRSAANGTNSCNDVYTAVCYLGGQGDSFTTAAKEQMVDLRVEWERRYGRKAGFVPHSACVATECPGAEIRAWLASGMPGSGSSPAPAPPDEEGGVRHNPPLEIAATWLDGGCVLAQVSPSGHVYAWGMRWYGNVAGRSWWGDRVAADIGPRPDGAEGYRITATNGQTYDLPNDTP